MTVYPIVPDFERYPEYGRDLERTFGEIGLAGHWIKILLHHMFLTRPACAPAGGSSPNSPWTPTRPDTSPNPTRPTLFLRTFLPCQLWRFAVINLKMIEIIRRSHKTDTTHPDEPRADSFTPPTVWDRVICAVDGSPESRAAHDRRPVDAARGEAHHVHGLRRSHRRGEDANARDKAVEQAQAAIQAMHDVELHLREGRAIERILDELVTEQATLLTLGASKRTTRTGMLLGPVAPRSCTRRRARS